MTEDKSSKWFKNTSCKTKYFANKKLWISIWI